MSVLEEGNHISAIEQMNQILFEKENVINKKRLELENYMAELKKFENELVQKTKDIQIWEKRLKSEEQKLKEKSKELQNFEEKLQDSTKEILAEKVKIEQLNKERLEAELKDNNYMENDTRLDLNSLRTSIGIIVPEEKGKVNNEVTTTDQIDPIPDLFRKLEKEIKKSYSKWSLLELVPERYCLEIGDKEIRFFEANNTLPYVQIIIMRKNAKTDRKLLNSIIGIERVAPDWRLEVKDNQVECTMFFSKETSASIVLKKCNDFMKTHF